jgi:hypothetical protein
MAQMQMRDSTCVRIGVAADRDFRDTITDREDPSQIGGEFVVFE